VARPVVAFVTATVAGIIENFTGSKEDTRPIEPDLSCPIDGCCDGKECAPEVHRQHHTFYEKLTAGMRFAVTEVWGDLVLLFFLGLFLAGVITYMIPDDVIGQYMGGGLFSMLIMLVVGIPLYICATASTPIAAALILKGVSPGAALVFLIAGPATNITSLTVLTGLLGKRATFIYLATIAVMAVLFGLAVDQIYAMSGISARATMGQAAEFMPLSAKYLGAFLLLIISIKPITAWIKTRIKKEEPPEPCTDAGFTEDVKQEPVTDTANCTGAT
jgi:uncharacterized membrane protein YraQ (UPF0718 family)